MASKAQTVMTALLGALKVEQTGTVYEPADAAVIAMLNWPDETALDSSLSTIYLVRLISEANVSLESCSVTKDLQIVILPCRYYTGPTNNPFAEDPQRYVISDDLAKDVEEKLQAADDTKLGGEVITVFARGRPFIDHERFYIPKWVVPYVETWVRIRHLKSER